MVCSMVLIQTSDARFRQTIRQVMLVQTDNQTSDARSDRQSDK